jgi:hypothetical protein
MDFVDRALAATKRNVVEGACNAVSAWTDTWGPECDMETVSLPENAWLQAVIALVVMKAFVHYCWLMEIACIPTDDRRSSMTMWWMFSAFVSAGMTVFNPGPNTPSGFFYELENLYVPLVVKLSEYNSIIFL